jgi:hypothetical protein
MEANVIQWAFDGPAGAADHFGSGGLIAAKLLRRRGGSIRSAVSRFGGLSAPDGRLISAYDYIQPMIDFSL